VLDGRTQDLVASGVLPQLVKDPAAYCIEYTDGTRATLLLLNCAIMDYNIAARAKCGAAYLFTIEISATKTAVVLGGHSYLNALTNTAVKPGEIRGQQTYP
jgi:hypothetical protein